MALRGSATAISSLRRRHRKVRMEGERTGITHEGQLSSARLSQWRAMSRSMVNNPGQNKRLLAVFAARKKRSKKQVKEKKRKLKRRAERQAEWAARWMRVRIPILAEDEITRLIELIGRLSLSHTTLSEPITPEGEATGWIFGVASDLRSFLGKWEDSEQGNLEEKISRLTEQEVDDDRLEVVARHPGGKCRWEGCEHWFELRHDERRRHEAKCSLRPLLSVPKPDKGAKKKKKTTEEAEKEDPDKNNGDIAFTIGKLRREWLQMTVEGEQWDTWSLPPRVNKRVAQLPKYITSELLVGRGLEIKITSTVKTNGNKTYTIHGEAKTLQGIVAIWRANQAMKGVTWIAPAMKKSTIIIPHGVTRSRPADKTPRITEKQQNEERGGESNGDAEANDKDNEVQGRRGKRKEPTQDLFGKPLLVLSKPKKWLRVGPKWQAVNDDSTKIPDDKKSICWEGSMIDEDAPPDGQASSADHEVEMLSIEDEQEKPPAGAGKYICSLYDGGWKRELNAGGRWTGRWAVQPLDLAAKDDDEERASAAQVRYPSPWRSARGGQASAPDFRGTTRNEGHERHPLGTRPSSEIALELAMKTGGGNPRGKPKKGLRV